MATGAASTAEGIAEAIAAVAGEVGSDDLRAPSQYEEETREAGTADASGSAPREDPGAQPSLAQVMQMLAQLINNMPATIAAGI